MLAKPSNNICWHLWLIFNKYNNPPAPLLLHHHANTTRCRVCCTDSHEGKEGRLDILFPASTGKYIKRDIKSGVNRNGASTAITRRPLLSSRIQICAGAALAHHIPTARRAACSLCPSVFSVVFRTC